MKFSPAELADIGRMRKYLQANRAEIDARIAQERRSEETVSCFAKLLGQSPTPAAFAQSLEPSSICWEESQDKAAVGHATLNGFQLELHRSAKNEVFKVSGVYHDASAPQRSSSGVNTTASTASATPNVESPTACLVNGARFDFQQSKVDGLTFECASGLFSWKEHRPPGGDTQTSASYPGTFWLEPLKPQVLTDSTNASSSV